MPHQPINDELHINKIYINFISLTVQKPQMQNPRLLEYHKRRNLEQLKL
ncbi:14820_t:CDS:1, partial [Gigaspora margarita]